MKVTDEMIEAAIAAAGGGGGNFGPIRARAAIEAAFAAAFAARPTFGTADEGYRLWMIDVPRDETDTRPPSPGELLYERWKHAPAVGAEAKWQVLALEIDAAKEAM